MRIEALVGLLEAGEHAQRRGLAAAGGSEQGEELAGLRREVEAVDGDHRAEALGDVRQLDLADVTPDRAVAVHVHVPQSSLAGANTAIRTWGSTRVVLLHATGAGSIPKPCPEVFGHDESMSVRAFGPVR